MNGRERMLAALERREPDKVPVWELIVDRKMIEALCGEKTYEDFIEIIDMDGATAGEHMLYEEVEEGVYEDEWGIRWRANRDGILYPVKGPIGSRGDLDRYSPPDPDADHRMARLESLVDRFKGERFIVFLGHDVFEFSHYLVGGIQNLVRLYYRDPGTATRLAEIVAEYKSRVLERAARTGADALASGDDYADKKGPLLSPRLFRRFVAPYLRSMVDVAKRHGKIFIKHTDGNIWPIIGDLVNAGIDALHPIEPAACMDIAKVKRIFGGRISVIGNIDCSVVLTTYSRRDVEEVVKETIAKAAPGGGYVLSSSNSIHPGVKPENFLAMIETARRFGRYPISSDLVEKYRGRDFYRKIFGCHDVGPRAV